MPSAPLRYFCRVSYQRKTNNSSIVESHLFAIYRGCDKVVAIEIVEASMRLRTSITVGVALLLTAAVAWSAPSAPAKGAAKGAKATRSSARPAVSPGKSRVKKSGRRSRRQPGQKAPAPERISEIQQALAKNGSFTGTPSGKLDESTV